MLIFMSGSTVLELPSKMCTSIPNRLQCPIGAFRIWGFRPPPRHSPPRAVGLTCCPNINIRIAALHRCSQEELDTYCPPRGDGLPRLLHLWQFKDITPVSPPQYVPYQKGPQMFISFSLTSMVADSSLTAGPHTVATPQRPRRHPVRPAAASEGGGGSVADLLLRRRATEVQCLKPVEDSYLIRQWDSKTASPAFLATSDV